MIKKIDANEYGVVRYAITSVDELNRLPKKIAPSSQAILIENGLRVFVYGDGQWVEEVVDGDLSENMQSIVADYERSKIGYDGVKRGSLGERLKDDFQGIYDMLNARDYCEYSGKELKVDNTWMGNQIDTRVEGRTLQNLLSAMTPRKGMSVNGGVYETNPEVEPHTGFNTKGMIKNNTTYTLVIEFLEIPTGIQAINFFGDDEFGNNYYLHSPKVNTRYVVAKTSRTDPVVSALYFGASPTNITEPIKFKAVLLEGNHRQTPLSELPFIEGIESVGDKSKNLVKGMVIDMNHAQGTYVMCEGNHAKRDSIIKLPKGKYFLSFEKFAHSELLDGGILIWDNTESTTWKRKNSNTSNFEILEDEVGITWYGSFSTKERKDEVVGSFIQIEEGTQATPYEPYYDGYKISGKSCGKNLFDGEWEIGGFNWSDGSKIVNNDRIRTVNYIKCKSNTTYVFDGATLNDRGIGIFEYDSDYKFVNSYQILKGHSANKRRIGTKANTRYIKIMLADSVDFDDKFIFEESNSLAIYEPYQESTYSIHSPIPLRSLPDGVCDVYDFESGAVIQRVGKVVLDGSEGWKLWYENTTVVSFFITIKDKISHHNILCDKFGLGKSYVDDIEGITVSGSVSTFGVAINKSKLPSADVQGLKDWLRVNPTTVYYELEEPIIHYLTPSQLKSFEGTTHVISENTLIPTTTTKILTSTYTNVSNVNSAIYSLRRGVNDVAETSAIINETDVEQDDVLDITMCAIDELYSMLEPNLE